MSRALAGNDAWNDGGTRGASQHGIAVAQPALDIPVQPTTITVPASGSVALTTPIRLRFHPGAPPSSERFVWSIAHAPEGIELTFTLDLPAPFDQPCRAQVAPG